MSYSNHIKISLGIKDDFIQISNIVESFINGVETVIVSGILTKNVYQCPYCNKKSTKENNIIVKNGTKTSRILLNTSFLTKAYLELKKQRFLCKCCGRYFTCHSDIVEPNCFISRKVKFSILKLLAEKHSAISIAKNCFVSWSTVQRGIHSLEPYLKINKEVLPKCIMVDEFRSMKNMEGKMSFICADGDTGALLDVLPTRRLDYIESYFMGFTYQARQKVEYIVTDMNAPYFELTKRCFPNAEVVVDRFHIVQHINRSFNKVRIRIMNSLKHGSPEQQRQYRQLKSLYKLLLKQSNKIDFLKYRKWRNYKWEYLREVDVVHRLISISDELKTSYNYYQKLLMYLKNTDDDSFFQLIKSIPSEIPDELKHIKKAFLKYENGIRNSMKLGYSNGKIESKNTHIKTLKRVTYGFKSFKNMKIRIFLLNNLIKFSY